MLRLAIIGSGDLGQFIAYHALNDGHYEIAGFFDDFKSSGSNVNGFKILGGQDDVLNEYASGKFDVLMIAIGYKHFKQRKASFAMFKGKIPFGKIIHSSSYLAGSSCIGEGVFILPGCILDHNTRIGDNVLINAGCCIAHDSIIKDHTFLSPRVAVAGFVTVGECCNLGINSAIIDNITLSDNIQTGGGTVITVSLTKPGLYVGAPARFIR